MKHFIFYPILLAACALLAHADVVLSSMFQDHAVLQREQEIPVWGSADKGEQVRVTLGSESKETAADENGRWMIGLSARPANAKPQELVVQGKNKIVIKDVLIGDVWLCAGQSNMGMQVKSCLDFEKEKKRATNSLIRSFRVGTPKPLPDKPQENVLGSWMTTSPDTVGSFSATAYFFARELQPKIEVPIGIISTAHGNTAIAAWRSSEAIAGEADVQKWWEAQLASSTPPRPHRKPSACYNGMLVPIAPYAIKGFLWYQGEADATVYDVFAPIYARQQAGLIKEYRELFKQKDAPFFWVSLAGYDKAGTRDWTGVRDQQNRTLRVPNTGQAIAYDIGDAGDIHPKNKQEVGRRLSLLALNRAYEIPTVDSGPIPTGKQSNGEELVVRFSNVGMGLECDNLDGAGLFEVAAADKEFHPVSSLKIEGSVVSLRSKEVKAPVYVRYAWQPLPNGALRNSFKLPAAPFEL